jgi:hypothetical protein
MSPTGTIYNSIPGGDSAQVQCSKANGGISCGTLYGNSGSGIVNGPGQFNFDISILKTTQIFEKQTLQFRAEFFNAFNHPQFTNPNFGQGAIYALPNFASGSFGQITSTSVNPRVIQLALKYIF